MDGVKCIFCYPDGEIILHIGHYISNDHTHEIKDLLKDLPKIPYKIRGKELISIIIDDIVDGEGNATR